MHFKLLLAMLALLAFPVLGGVQDDLMDRLNAFAIAYNAFAAKVNQGQFDLPAAQQLSKLWHRIEGHDWPKE
jgi:hypothetical protein